MRDAANDPRCVCAEINMRHCPVHGQGEVESAAKRQELERLRGLLAEAKAVLDFFNEDSPERQIATAEERARWIMRYDGIVAALDNEAVRS